MKTTRARSSNQIFSSIAAKDSASLHHLSDVVDAKTSTAYDVPKIVAAGPPAPRRQSLIDFFSDRRNRTVRAAKRTLLLALGELASQQDLVRNLSAESILVRGDAGNLRVELSGQPPGRPDWYEDPEPESDVWLQNQYALGAAFYYAVSLSRDSGVLHEAGAGLAIPLEVLAPSLGGRFSDAIAKMTARSGAKRFRTAKEAIRVVRGLGDSNILWRLGALVALFSLLACAVLGYTLVPRGSEVRTPVHPGMVRVDGGLVVIAGVTKQVPPFYLDARTVTISQYEAYATKKGKRLPFGAVSRYSKEFPKHPAFNVSWPDAVAYCADNGKRLPSETEWKLAVDNAGYVWGAGVPEPGQANVDTGALVDAGATAGDKTAGGIYDLVGNIPEWGADDFDTLGLKKVVLGGGYYLPASVIGDRLGMPRELDARRGYLRVGFRCAVNAE